MADEAFAMLAFGCKFDPQYNQRVRELFTGRAKRSGSAANEAAASEEALDFFNGSSDTGNGAASSADAASSKKDRKKKRDAAIAAADEGGATVAAVDEELASMTEREVADANALRRAMRIHVYGTGVPAPVQSAEDMGERFALKGWLRSNVLTDIRRHDRYE